MPYPEHEKNRQAWNEVTPVHNSHKGDQAVFFRSGGSTLAPEERDLVGDVRGLALLHLQCNCGQDSLSWARLGAQVTGVDISDEAIAFARTLSIRSGIEARFIRDDALDFLRTTEHRFDRVVATYGCLAWLKDIESWAHGIARVLKANGRFVIVEFHPAALVFDEDWRPANPYSSHGQAVPGIGVPDYVGLAGPNLVTTGFEEGIKEFQGQCPVYEFFWSLSEVVGALIAAGLTILRLEEYPYSRAPIFNRLEQKEDRRLYPPADAPLLPLMYGMIVEKPSRGASTDCGREPESALTDVRAPNL
jgi:SAM-dependent methyltransferase